MKMPSNGVAKDIRHYVGSLIVFFLVVLILYYLTKYTIPDQNSQIVNTLIESALFDPQKKNKLIFDGYPRSLAQAKNLEILLKKTNQKIDFIFFLNVNKETIIKRIEQRKIVEKRSDDDLNTFIKRFDTYMETTKPVLDFYSKNPNFYEIDGASKIEEITRKIDNFIRV